MLPKSEVDEALVGILEISQKAARVGRGLAFFVVAALLLSASPHHVEAFWTVALAIGLLGVMGSSARIGQICLAILAVLAVLPAGLYS